jgi:hypothetical protein
MSLSTITETSWNGPQFPALFCPAENQPARIIAVFGLTNDGPPRVSEETLCRYYKYLTVRLSFPFAAYYPQPTTSLEEVQHRCTVLELLDPATEIYDEFDGIFCKTRKGKYSINLPLIELQVPENSCNFQLIEDYWYWFWNWR